MRKIVRVEEVEPVPSRCIEVDNPRRLFASGGVNGAGIVSHNSVTQRNVVLSCILRANQPEEFINIILVDLKRVEMSSWRGYKGVLGVATELDKAVTALRFAQTVMMSRYSKMEEMGIVDMKDLAVKGERNPLGPVLIVMVDELGELISPSEAKALSENTLIATPSGYKKLGEIEVGDIVYDGNSNETIVEVKYEPHRQDKYEVSFVKKSDSEKDFRKTFISGSEHDWKICFVSQDGSTTKPMKVDTTTLKKLYDEENAKTAGERRRIAVIRGKRSGV